MNSRQKLVQQAFLNREDVVLKRLDAVYTQAAKDCAASIKQQYAEIQLLTDAINQLPPGDPQRVILESRRQSKIYQKTYQEALQKQIDDILKNTRQKEYKTVSEYLEGCYDEGYLGAMYDLHGQGIPIITPINQQRMVHAVQLDSKISQGLYTRLGQNITVLKRKITAQVSRCMATGISFHQCAQLLDGASGIGHYNSMRIVRTEGHRIQTTAQMDAMADAKDNGCDVVKQWDAALDDRTRESHQMVDGEIREIDEPFSNGLMYPGDPKGSAEEVIHCRCALLQRARWALGQAELDTLKQRAAYYGLDKSKNFDDFKQKYMQAVAVSQNGGTITVPYSDSAQIGGLSTYPKKHQQIILDYMDKAPDECRRAWNVVCNDFHTITGVEYKAKTGRRATGAFYSPLCDAVYLNISTEAKGSTIATPYQVVFHEFGHHMDYILNRRYGDGNSNKAFTETYQGGIFGKTIKMEARAAIESYWKQTNGNAPMNTREAEKQFCQYIRNNYSMIARGDISDMFEPVMATTQYPFGAGHGSSYWRTRDNGKEGFAEMYSAKVNNPESWAVINQYFPESVKIFEEMLKVVL